MPVNPAFMYRCDDQDCDANAFGDSTIPKAWTEDTSTTPSAYYCPIHSQQQ